MTSPINNQFTTSVTTTTTTSPSVTVSSTLGDHSITSTGSGSAAATAENVSSTAEPVVSQAESLGSPDSVVFTREGHTVTTTGSGATQATATAANLMGGRILLGGRNRSESTSSSDSDSSVSSDTSVGGAEGEDPSIHADDALRSLEELTGTVVTEGAARSEGPGGLPSMQIPSYDPTDKASILKFLATPSVQAKLVTKGGHIVYRDHARGSFIFIRNGDWNSACSISVTNGRTKAPITDVGELDRCVARFCVGYETFHADFENRVRPDIERRTGATGEYSHLLMSMKFKTTVVYGPWNKKESSGDYTPSVWRRGTKVKSGEIWGDMGGFDGINWNTTSRPPQPDDGVAFSQETRKPGGGAGRGEGAASPFQMPTININLGGIHTRVDVTGGTTSTSVSTGASEGDQVSTTENTEDTSNVDKTSNESSNIESTTEDIDTEVPPPPGPPPPSRGGTNITGMSSETLSEVLQHVRQHLDTVYDQEGNHHQGNQDLGTVVRTSENGTWQPTVLLDTTPQTDRVNDRNDDDNASGGVSGDIGNVNRGDETNRSKQTQGIEEDEGELQNILDSVRSHLNVVYPQDSEGEPIPVNQNLGQVIDDVEANRQPSPTKPETTKTETTNQSSKTSETSPQSSVARSSGKPRTQPASTTSKLVTATQTTRSKSLEYLLPRLRAHLDKSFDKDGNLVGGQNNSVGGIIAAFRVSTGSGGLVGSLLTPHTVVTTTTPQQSATVEQLPRSQTAEILETDRSGSKLQDAAAGVAASLSNVLSSATSTGSTVSTPSPATQTAVSESVGGTRGIASPLSSDSPSELPQAAAGVTSKQQLE
ncbi:type III secretion system actin-recruiting effector Tarp [Chlamydia avium]|uniref:type III secretion system actin-recruiting effector Tarp n=1 Tax=Chlamydia avium TaxID=1457141 RepID=UPI001F11AC38|nr:type III secretion system actin-recruiting effector Tarp [Chlamydia avium]